MALGVAEIFGLRPVAPALRAALSAVRGSPHAPPNRFGLSSLRIFKPWIGLPAWVGWRRPDRRVPLYNYFNRVRAPRDEGYSVRVTYARDVRGGRHTYDGHLGTDFAVPVGTAIVAAAPGIVLRVGNDFAQGGLKVCIDHGNGLLTTSNHLSRALVPEGRRVRRGEPVGLSGASGLEFVLFFPWVSPHLHFNVWLDGEPVDPFGAPGEAPLWRAGNDPVPDDGQGEEDSFAATSWDPRAVDRALDACRDPGAREQLRRVHDVGKRAVEVLLLRNYRPALFDRFPSIYAESHARRPLLDLPFRRHDVSGVAFP